MSEQWKIERDAKGEPVAATIKVAGYSFTVREKAPLGVMPVGGDELMALVRLAAQEERERIVASMREFVKVNRVDEESVSFITVKIIANSYERGDHWSKP